MRIVAHVHDEIIIEADCSVSLEEICRRMAEVPPGQSDWVVFTHLLHKNAGNLWILMEIFM